ncbi:MAG: hypothetical protein ACREXT_11400, partial [Gammaproteobacteria bacterium]
GVTGQFDSVATNLAFLDPLLTYGSTSIELTLARNDMGFVDLASANQRDVGAALDAMLRFGSADASVVDALRKLTDAEVGPLLDAVSGQPLSAIPRLASLQNTALTQQITSRLGALSASPDPSFASEFDRGVLLAMNDRDTSLTLPIYAAAWVPRVRSRATPKPTPGCGCGGLAVREILISPRTQTLI